MVGPERGIEQHLLGDLAKLLPEQTVDDEVDAAVERGQEVTRHLGQVEPLAARVLRTGHQVHDQIRKLAQKEGHHDRYDHESDARVQLERGLFRQRGHQSSRHSAAYEALPLRRLLTRLAGRLVGGLAARTRVRIVSTAGVQYGVVALGRRGGRVLSVVGAGTEQALFAPLGVYELLRDANVHDEENGEGQAVDEDEVAVAAHDQREDGRAREARHARLIVGLIERGGHADRFDLEPARQVVHEAEEEDEADGGERVAQRADLVGLERPRHVDPAVDGDRTGQVEREELKRGEDGRPDAVDEADVALVLVDDVGVARLGRVENHVAEHLVGEDVAQRVEEYEVDEAHDVGERQSGQVGVRGEGAHAGMQQHENGEPVEYDAEHAQREEQVAVDEETRV